MFVSLSLIAQLLSVESTSSNNTVASLTSYDQAIHCAGLTQAASELEGGESINGRRLFDAALYWSISTIQATRVAGRDPIAADRAITRIRVRAVHSLTAKDEATQHRLNECLRKAPSLQ